MPPHHCHHCHHHLPTDFEQHAREVNALARRIFGSGVSVTVRYGVEPVSEVDLVGPDEAVDPNARRHLAEFGRRLENDLGAATMAKWVLFDPGERTRLEFPAEGPAPPD
jgi:hypothetical protein